MACETSRRCAQWETQFSARCHQYETELQRRCAEYERRQEQRCADWETRNEQRCDDWRSTTTRSCDDWHWLISWLCLAWAYVTTWICDLWTTVTTTFCRLWQWVTVSICTLWTWIAVLVCRLYVFVVTLLCRLWVLVLDLGCIIRCWIRRLFAPVEVSDPISECKFGWNAKYRIEDIGDCILQITLRIKLVFESSITEEQKTAARDRWEPAIEETWTDRFKIQRTDGSCKCNEYTIRVDVQWVEGNEHHSVNVAAGSGRADMTNWFIGSTRRTAAHEAGHMFGNPDEYEEEDVCPDRTVHTDNTVMGSGTEAKARHYQRFANWISNRTCCTYEVKS